MPPSRFALLLSLVSSLILHRPLLAQAKVEVDLTGPQRVLKVVPKGEDATVTIKNMVPGVRYQVGSTVVSPSLPDGKDHCQKLLDQFREASKGKDESAIASTLKTLQEAKPCDEALTKKTVEAIEESFVHSTTFPVPAEGSFELKISRKVDETPKSWTVEIMEESRAAAALAERRESITIDEQRERTRSHPDLIVKRCEFGKIEDCEKSPIYINADHVSTITFTKVPENARLVRVFAGERWACKALETNHTYLQRAHDTVVVPLHMRTPVLSPLFGVNARREIYGLGLYGYIVPNDNLYVLERGRYRPVARSSRHVSDEIRHDVCRAAAMQTMDDVVRARNESSNERDAAAKRPTWERFNGMDFPSVPLMIRGRSQIVTVEFADADGNSIGTFNVPLRYQRFWLDAGGFFAFSRLADEEVIKEPGADGKTRVFGVREITDIDAATGIVVNVHPGNFPYLAWQFGIAARQDRQPSYYLGLGLRAREIGKRGLATLAVGMAVVQANRFGGFDLEVDNTKCDSATRPCALLPSDSALLTAQSKYVFEPYASISLGFSFGGVSEGTNVTSAVGSN
jgi:hypothetical protein